MSRGRSLCSLLSAFKSLRRYLKKNPCFECSPRSSRGVWRTGGEYDCHIVIVPHLEMTGQSSVGSWAPMQIPPHRQVYNTSIRTVLKCSESNWSISSLFTKVFINRIH